MSGPEAGVSSAPAAASPGAFAPLRHRLFAVMWMATVIGNVGTFIRDVTSGWLVVEISSSPGAVAMIQATATLPVFLLAIPAGALADIVDRRRFLIIVQIFLTGVSAILAVLAATGKMTVTYLALLTFSGGVGAALLGPTWQSVVPELVSKNELKGAIALNSLGFNIARAIGPAIGGLLLAAIGAAFTYSIDVLTYVLVVGAIVWWRRAPKSDDQLGEQFSGAMRAGLRFAWANRDLRRILFRASLFLFFGNVTWALLPIIARDVLGGSAGFYGAMLGAIGVGAVLGAMVMPQLRKKLSADGLVLMASLLMAGILAAISFKPSQFAGIVLALFFGAAWIAVLTTLNAMAQAVLPNWVRGRGLAIYLMAFNGAVTAGSLCWGAVGERIGVPSTLLVGGALLAITAAVAYRYKLPEAEADLTPSSHWPEPAVAEQVDHDRGPVLVTIEYKVKAQDRGAFFDSLTLLSHERRRDGAYAWGMSEDTADSERILEWFFVESWAEHLRQHRRVSMADADLQGEVVKFHSGAQPPKVTHYVALERPSMQPDQLDT